MKRGSEVKKSVAVSAEKKYMEVVQHIKSYQYGVRDDLIEQYKKMEEAILKSGFDLGSTPSLGKAIVFAMIKSDYMQFTKKLLSLVKSKSSLQKDAIPYYTLFEKMDSESSPEILEQLLKDLAEDTPGGAMFSITIIDTDKKKAREFGGELVVGVERRGIFKEAEIKTAPIPEKMKMHLYLLTMKVGGQQCYVPLTAGWRKKLAKVTQKAKGLAKGAAKLAKSAVGLSNEPDPEKLEKKEQNLKDFMGDLTLDAGVVSQVMLDAAKSEKKSASSVSSSAKKPSSKT